MDDTTTFPALLAAETIPVPLSLQSPLETEPHHAGGGFAWLVKLLAFVMLMWFIARHW